MAYNCGDYSPDHQDQAYQAESDPERSDQADGFYRQAGDAVEGQGDHFAEGIVALPRQADVPLIIDDLGTEMTNSFVGTELFTIINERFNARRSVIISTNLELPLLRDRYSDRIFSRITGSYDVLKMCGPDLRSVY